MCVCACAYVRHTTVKSTKGQCRTALGSFQLLEEPARPHGPMGLPPPSPAPTPQASSPREGDKVGLVGKDFFFVFLSVLFFFFFRF